jgi:hypothetical protein
MMSDDKLGEEPMDREENEERPRLDQLVKNNAAQSGPRAASPSPAAPDAPSINLSSNIDAPTTT